MPKLKNAEYIARNSAGTFEKLKTEIHVGAGGDFYCYVPSHLADVLDKKHIDSQGRKEGYLKVYASTLEKLDSIVEAALHKYITPEITVEHVIRFNIESHVSFVVGDDGNIYQNGYCCEGGKWANKEMFGEHHAASPAKGGYSLTIGAQAVTKTTHKYGDKSRVSYENYYKGESHLVHENPAQKLNAWCSFRLPDNCREIPYTDEAALFFHNLLMGMAVLSKRVQEATFNTDNLLHLIDKSQGQLLIGGPST